LANYDFCLPKGIPKEGKKQINSPVPTPINKFLKFIED
jgi:hypothetical protein